jgi:hypothetical protein
LRFDSFPAQTKTAAWRMIQMLLTQQKLSHSRALLVEKYPGALVKGSYRKQGNPALDRPR